MIIGTQEEILRFHSLGLLELLLRDKTTKTNILWATDAYQSMGPEYDRDEEIRIDLITGQNSGVIKNYARKALEQKTERSGGVPRACRDRAEENLESTAMQNRHMAMAWPAPASYESCRRTNEDADTGWFPKRTPHPFDSREKVRFLSSKKWWNYVDARRLEPACGEAPYLVSRYDIATGECIPIERRVGLLDHKLRIVGENASDDAEWIIWALRALQSVYGYELQGDSVLIARVNLLMSFEEYLQERWQRKPTYEEYRTAARIISWNIWQMDEQTATIPYRRTEKDDYQWSVFDYFSPSERVNRKSRQEHPYCRVYDWRRDNSLEFRKTDKGNGRKMKFNFIVGNSTHSD
ncbi:MAG: restriction endonuclease subunit M [Lachnospiraceae bacterium]|nr:restriction endonuclease subunit M [Lachnospiraceae bacterium]